VSLRAAIAERVLAPVGGPAQELAEALVQAVGPEARAILFFGSRRTGAKPDPYSAYDFFVVTPAAAREFYRALRRTGALHRSDLAMTALQHMLPPSQLSFRTPSNLLAKLAVQSLPQLLRQTGPDRQDHFVAGRLCQPTALLHAASDEDRSRVLDALESAHRETFGWVGPWLPATFTVDDYVRHMLRVSFSWEIRPEPAGRADALFEAQQEYHRPVYGALLAELVASGRLVTAPGGAFALAQPVEDMERWRRSGYFRVSILRSTLRWGKHVFTFENWLDFLLRKVRRHGGGEIQLTERERRMPLIFLWPRIIEYLRHKDRKGGPA
jgi:hypothetical protein